MNIMVHFALGSGISKYIQLEFYRLHVFQDIQEFSLPWSEITVSYSNVKRLALAFRSS